MVHRRLHACGWCGIPQLLPQASCTDSRSWSCTTARITRNRTIGTRVVVVCCASSYNLREGEVGCNVSVGWGKGDVSCGGTKLEVV